jgi:DNA-binding MarR family transcriptional regulator
MGEADGDRRRSGDRFRTLNTFVDCTLRDLGRNELAVWLVLYRDARDGIAQTSQADLARRTGACDRTVRRALARLAERGLVEVVRRGRLQDGPSAYRLHPVEPDRPP